MEKKAKVKEQDKKETIEKNSEKNLEKNSEKNNKDNEKVSEAHTISESRRNFIYFEVIMGVFISIILISNIASTKIAKIGPLVFDGGTLLFPLSYILGDVLTEVYGYKRSRKVLWTGFACALLMSVVLLVVQYLPSAAGWENQTAYELILGQAPRIVIASLIAFLIGGFSNSYILARMKVATKGKYLWARLMVSTLVGELLDTLVFCMIAFYGAVPVSTLIAIIISNYVIKCGIELFFSPLTSKIIQYLKRKENEDFYDKNTDFNPFTAKGRNG